MRIKPTTITPNPANVGQSVVIKAEIEFLPLTWGEINGKSFTHINNTEWIHIDQRPSQIRYIRDYLNGNTKNSSNHWVEIQAYDKAGVNVALNKGGTSSSGGWNKVLTDGNTATSSYWTMSSGEQWVQVDLGGLYKIDSIHIWHYYSDGRTYYGTKTAVSADGVNWFVVFDGETKGYYVETPAGHKIYL